MGMHRRPSAAQRRIYLRRRIIAAVIVLAVIIIPIVVLTSGGGSKKKVAGSHQTTTTTVGRTTVTVAPQMVVSTASWHLPVPLSRSVVLPINTNLGIFGGLTTTGTSRDDYEIDPASGIPTLVGTMPSPVRDAGGAVIGSTYFTFGGAPTAATASAAVQQFSFTTASHLTGSVVTALSNKRSEMGTTSYNAQTYLVGGFDGKQWLGSILATSDGMTFTTIAQLATPVRYPAVAAVGGKLYVIGGELSPNAADSTTVQELNLTTDAVTTLPPLPAGLSHAAAAVIDNTIYVFGGRSGGHAIATISELNTTTGQLLAVGQLPGGVGRSDMGITVIGDTAYLIGGETSSGVPLNTVVTVALGPA